MREQPATHERQVVVVGGDALERPQLPRIGLARQVVGQERGRLDPLHVPGVEILVAGQPEQRTVPVAGLGLSRLRQVIPAAQQAGRAAVLEATVAVSDHRDLEQVAAERRRRAEQVDLGDTGARKIAGEPIEVATMATGERDVVAHAVRVERHQVEGATFDRMVDQFVVVGGAIAAEAMLGRTRALERRGNPPGFECLARRRLDIDRAAFMLAPRHRQEHGTAVEVGMRGVEVRRAHRQVPCVDLAGHRQRTDAGRAAPTVLVDLGHRHRQALTVACTDSQHLASELAHEVAARDPDRQPERLAGWLRIGHPHGHLEAVCLRRSRHDQVVDLFHVRSG